MMKRIAIIFALIMAVTAIADAQSNIVRRRRSVTVYQITPEKFTSICPNNRNITPAQYEEMKKVSQLLPSASVFAFDNAAQKKRFIEKFTFMDNENGADKLVVINHEEMQAGTDYASVETLDEEGSCTIATSDEPEFVIDTENFNATDIYYLPLKGEFSLSIFIVDATRTMNELHKTAQRKKREVRPGQYSSPGTKSINVFAEIDSSLANGHLRYAAQFTVKEYETNTTFKITRPVILNGKEFQDKQIKRMGYNIKERDPYAKYTIQDHFMETGKADTLRLKDIASITKPDMHYPVWCRLLRMNHSGIIGESYFEVDDGRDLQPMRFIEMTFDNVNIDYGRYEKYGENVKGSDKKSINMFFKVGKAVLDADDIKGLQSLNEAVKFAQDIFCNSDNLSPHFIITGYASPEGDYKGNADLAMRRAQYLKNQIKQQLASYGCNDNAFTIQPAVVQPWTVVADSLDALKYYDEAEQVRNICKMSSDMHQQQARIMALPYYKTTILEEVLPKLRIDNIEASWDIYRVKSRDEVLNDYYANKDAYINGSSRAPYEYYQLFQEFENDMDELGPLARAAYNKFRNGASGFNDGFKMDKGVPDRAWSLSAYHYARYLLHIGQPNDTILNPYLSLMHPFNFPTEWNPKSMPRNRYAGSKWLGAATYNDEAIAMLQIRILCHQKRYSDADSIYQGCVDTNKYPTLRYFLECFANPMKTQQTEYYNGLAATSEWNKMVIYAMQHREDCEGDYKGLNLQALDMIESNQNGIFDPEDPRVNYIKGIIQFRLQTKPHEKDFTKAFSPVEMKKNNSYVTPLLKAIQADRKYFDKELRWDGYFNKPFYLEMEKYLNGLEQQTEEQQNTETNDAE